MALRFSGKKVFITGASSGIGKALALEFASEGADVALVARRADCLEQVAAEVQKLGRQAAVAVADVTKPETLEAAAAKAVATLGGIDIVIANAGYGVNGIFQELTIADFRRQMETNFFGVVNTIYATLPHLKKARGRVVVMSSITGRVGFPTCSVYGSSKFAVNGLAECLYYDLAEDGIAVSWINPGIVASDIARVDNQGVYHPERKDPRHASLMMPTDQAARQMVRAIYRGKTEIIITFHGKAMIWLNRHFSGLWRFFFHLRTKGKLQKFKENRRSAE